ncbi:hypothetical protein [Dactylosporangium salmoneum]|uniref:hypothetical protein n=1 Tax=Dactylosporangium salmoneum TaxID=53361 RepID=UPI003CD05C8E
MRDQIRRDVEAVERAVRVVPAEVEVPQQARLRQRGGRGDLLAADPVGLLLRLGRRVADDDRRARQDADVVLRAAGGAQAGADVVGERQGVVELDS